MKRRLVGVFLAFCVATAFALSAAAREYDATEETPEESVSEASAGELESEGALLAGSIVASGECGVNGSNVTWTLDSNGLLNISGSGKMKNYGSYDSQYSPWHNNRLQIQSAYIQDGVTSIGDYAFYRCSGLTGVTIPNSVTSIGSWAFSGCSGLTGVTIPNSVTSIAEFAFNGCSGLASVTIPDSVTSIGRDAFYGCSGLTSVMISNSITSIELNTFYGCSGLTSVMIPNGVTSIGGNAFKGCSRLTNVAIPSSVTSIGYRVFEYCNNLTNIAVDDGNPSYISSNGILFSKNQKTLVIFPGGKIGEYNIPDDVTSIRSDAFSSCIGLTSVIIPASVTSIGSGVFADCTGLTSIVVDDGNPSYISLNGILFSKDRKTIITFPAGKTGEYSIPASVISIQGNAFEGCSGLTSVTIPNSVTSIGSDAFDGCSGLTSVTIPNSVTSIGNDAFYGCSRLTSVTISNGVTSIARFAFYGCSGLTSVTIPNSVTSIETEAFGACSGLTSVTIPDSVTSIGNYAFEGKLKDVYYAGNEAQWKAISIGADNNALKTATIHYNSSGEIQDDFIFIAAGSASNLVDSDAGLYREYAAVEHGEVKILLLREGITLPAVKNGVGSLKVADGYDKPALSTIIGASFDSDDIIVSASACPDAYYARGIRRVNSEEVRVNTSQPDNSTLLDVAENVRVYFVDGDEIEEISYDEIVNDIEDRVFYILSADGEITRLFICEDNHGDGELQTGEFVYCSSITKARSTYSYSYEQSWFFIPSDTYQHGLARMSIRMAMAAFGIEGNASRNGSSRRDGNSTISYLADEDPDSTSEGIVSLLKDLDFTDIQICYPKPGTDTIGYAIASKPIANSDGTSATLIAVAVRGGGYKEEWASNFTVGTASEHSGFARGANTVSQAVRTYITKIGARENLKIWVTGYSRAAAVANMTAQRLTYQANNGAVRGLTASDVFAYCFECPRMVTTDSPSYQAVVYDNIFNIVNYVDLVPKLAMEAWDFDRYGITYYVPSAEQTRNYNAAYEKLLIAYCKIIASARSSAVNYGIQLEALKYSATMTGQGRFTNVVANRFARYFWSQSNYANGYESRMRKIGSTMGRDFAKGIIGIGEQVVIYLRQVIDTMPAFIPSNLDIISRITTNYAFIGYAHYPELCLAWMDAIDGESGYCVDARTRILLVNCPVNVSVYDSSGALVAQIINDNPVEIDGSMIAAYIDENGQKVVLLPADEEYQIEVTATDNGTMSYQIEEMDADSGAAARLVSYYDLPVSSGESFTGTAENLREDSEARYQLTGADNQTITPTVDVSENIDEYLISVSVEGHGAVSGAGSYVVGEYVRLTARADSGEAFLGWYQDNALISTDLEYRFRVEDNQSLAAKFSDQHYKIQDISDSDNVMTVSVTGRAVLSGTLLAALYTQDGQLVSVSSANITQAGEIPIRLTERKNAEIVTVFIFSNDNERKPLCQCLTQSLDFLP